MDRSKDTVSAEELTLLQAYRASRIASSFAPAFIAHDARALCRGGARGRACAETWSQRIYRRKFPEALDAAERELLADFRKGTRDRREWVVNIAERWAGWR